MRAAHESETKELERIIRDLLSSEEQRKRLAGIAAIRSLLANTKTESASSRSFRTVKALTILETEDVVKHGDVETSKASVELLALFAKENGNVVKRFVYQSLQRALADIMNPLFRDTVSASYRNARMRRNCMVVEGIGPQFPVRIMDTVQNDNLIPALGGLVLIDSVREMAVPCLVSILETCSRSERNGEHPYYPSKPLWSSYWDVTNIIANEATKAAVTCASPRPEDIPKVHGVMALTSKIFACEALHGILRWVDPTGHGETFYDNLGVYLISLLGYQNRRVQAEIAIGITNLCKFDPGLFCQPRANRNSIFAEDAFAWFFSNMRDASLDVKFRRDIICGATGLVETIGKSNFLPFLREALALCHDLLTERLRISGKLEGSSGRQNTIAMPLDGNAPTPAQSLGVLEFVRAVTAAVEPDSVIFMKQAPALLHRLLRFEISVVWAEVLSSFVEVAPDYRYRVQRAVMTKVEVVLANSAEVVAVSNVGIESAVRSGESQSRLNRGLAGRPDNLRSISSAESSQLACRELFIPRTEENSEPGYVTALAGLQRQLPRGPADIDLQDIEFDFELAMDPSLRKGSSEFDLNTKATPRIALYILANFSFDTQFASRLAWFTNQFVVSFLEVSSIVERRLAVKAVANLMLFAARKGDSSGLQDKMFMVLSSLAGVAVADPSRRVRLTALKSLNDPHEQGKTYFELYLVQPEILRCLGHCLHDEDVGVRGVALTLVCRLYKLDSAEVEPILIGLLRHLLTVLRYRSHAFRGMCAQASRLLQMLIRNCRDFVHLYSSPIEDVLLSSLREQLSNPVAKVDASATLPLLEAIGDLASIFVVELNKVYVSVLVPLLVSTILDVPAAADHNEFRVSSLRALARVVQHSALTCKPYVADQRLLPSLLSNLRSETNNEIRIEALQLLGAVGAANPDKEHNKYVSLPSTQTANTVGNTSLRGLNTDAAPQAGSHDPRVLAGSRIQGNHPPANGLHAVVVDGAVSAAGVSGVSTGSQHRFMAGVVDPGSTGDEIMRPPPLVPCAARGNDLEYAAKTFKGHRPCWAQESLRTESLVSRLKHPFTGSDLYFPSAVLDVLLRIVGHGRHAAQHISAVESIVYVVWEIKTAKQCDYFLPSIVPRFLWLLQPPSSGDRLPLTHHMLQLFERLAHLVAVVGADFEPYVLDTVALCRAYLSDDNLDIRQSAVRPISFLLRTMAREIGTNFRPYAVYMLNSLVCALMLDRTVERTVTMDVIKTIVSFGDLYADYSCLVLPALVAVAENMKGSVDDRIAAVQAIGFAVECYHHVPELIPSILHALIRLLGTGDDISAKEKRFATCSMRAIRAVSHVAPSQFTLFVPVVAKALIASGVDRTLVEARALEAVLLQMNPDVAADILGYSVDPFTLREVTNEYNRQYQSESIRDGFLTILGSEATGNQYKHAPTSSVANRQVLEDLLTEWDVVTSIEWTNWMDSLGAELLKCSNAPAMRAVAGIGQNHPLLVRELFNAAFLSCWSTLEALEPSKFTRMIETFKNALSSKTIPPHAKQALLDLCEFMDHDERPLPIDGDDLAKAAVDVGAFAKAVRLKETAYSTAQTMEDLRESVTDRYGLIEIYNRLGHSVSALGTLHDFVDRAAGDDVAREVKQQYSETLKLLPEALEDYVAACRKLPADIDLSTVSEDSEKDGRELYKKSQTEELSPEDARDMKWYVTLSRLRVLDKLGQWRDMEDLAEDVWSRTETNDVARQSIAVSGRGCSVAFDLSNNDRFRERVQVLEGTENWDEHFYKTLLCIREARNVRDSIHLKEALQHIGKAREVLDTLLRTRAAEGYPRAYDDFLNAQHLVELEEMVECIRAGKPESGMKRMATLWSARIDDAREDQHTWYRLLMIRSLLLDPSENQEHWLKFVTKCRKDQKLPMATEALRKLLRHVSKTGGLESDSPRLELVQKLLDNEDDTLAEVRDWTVESISAIPDPALQFACIKHMWASNNMEDAFTALREMARSRVNGNGHHPLPRMISLQDDSDLMSQVFLKLAKWSERLAGERSKVDPSRTISTNEHSLYYSQKAIDCKHLWYKSWHFWASLNDKLALEKVRELEEKAAYESGKEVSEIDTETPLPQLPVKVISQLSTAIDGYFRAIDIGGKTGLEDVLTLLSLWFRFGSHMVLSKRFMTGFNSLDPIRWLEVVPQIIARLHTPSPVLRCGIEELMTRIGKLHPHAAVYPLTVAVKTPVGSKAQDDRRKSAEKILKAMEIHHRDIVIQARMMADELERVAILDHETWYDGIEEASRLYYAEHNISGMLNLLQNLHDDMQKNPPVTKCEEKFRADYGADLGDAFELGKQYLAALSETEGDDAAVKEQKLLEKRDLIDQAWELYYQVFRRIQKEQSTLNSLHMLFVSPKLARCAEMALIIPGKYRRQSQHGGKSTTETAEITIARFENQLDVIQSKQRPRKLHMIGSDGKKYGFLLKGHDDLRQDERVMQVFGLINEHLAQSEDRSVREGAQIKRYNVVVLSSKAGLIEWVPHCDTMHHLVKTFRENRSVIPNVEHKVMLRIASEPEKLTLLQRVDLFNFMLQNTSGRDIARVLWLRSRNSEMWLDRRTNYARTLATTSIAGYILGLGDRHPSNIMIERVSGKVMHIDFGDCFEVAMQREKYPETVPFRLTRMLVQALEPCGVGGHFHYMAVAILRVLRQENTRGAVLSMMEAFIYDPLIRQRLVEAGEARKKKPADSEPRSGDLAPTGRIAEEYGGSLAAISARENGLPPEAVPESSRPTDHHSRRVGTMRGEGLSEGLIKVANERARKAISRVEEKLTGRDFYDVDDALTVEEQVDRLIEQATSVENLCVLFNGYVSCW